MDKCDGRDTLLFRGKSQSSESMHDTQLSGSLLVTCTPQCQLLSRSRNEATLAISREITVFNQTTKNSFAGKRWHSRFESVHQICVMRCAFRSGEHIEHTDNQRSGQSNKPSGPRVGGCAFSRSSCSTGVFGGVAVVRCAR